MIAPGSGVRVYLACGRTDMRKGMDGLAMLIQQHFAEDPFKGAVFAFRGRKASQIKLIWHDGVGFCLLTRRLERGGFPWPESGAALISLSPAQLATLLEGCEWRRRRKVPPAKQVESRRRWAPVRSLRPETAG